MLVTPIKIQGKKTKIIPDIINLINIDDNTIWIEPFLGSGEVLFNINPKYAIVSDNNEHIINFYKNIQNGKINSTKVREFLEYHGKKLEKIGESYYYSMREKFNKNHDPLYFLFLNRSCFNGIIRFNSKNEFNVPFCKKNNRFSKALITKIVNQTKAVEKIIKEHGKNWEFHCCDWTKTYNNNIDKPNALFYFDPPYIKRHTDYFERWTEESNKELFKKLKNTKINFLLSNWYKNQYRENEILIKNFQEEDFIIHKINHFYHVGGKESNRNQIIECLIEKRNSTN